MPKGQEQAKVLPKPAPASSSPLDTFLKKAPKEKVEAPDAAKAIAAIEAAKKDAAKIAMKAKVGKALRKAAAKIADDGCGCWGPEEEESDAWD